MDIAIILDIIYVIGGALAVAIPMLIKLIAAIKARKLAVTAKEKAEADAAIAAQIKLLVVGAEKAYKQLDLILKQQNSSAGEMKKRDVMTSLKAFCLENNYEWNEELMNIAVDAEVEYTRQVNSNAKEVSKAVSNIL